MKKNTASQVIGSQMNSATDGTAFTGAVTCYVTGDGGTQAAGSVGSGACTHEGNGFHTYTPAQAETNYDHIGFTFTGSGAITVTVQVYTTHPQTGDSYALANGASGFVAIKGDTAAILLDTGTDGVVVVPASKTGYTLTPTTGLGNQTANITGTISTVTAVTNGVSLADDAITAAKFDESTAFPLKSADTGATAVSRTGADSDTNETLSDQLDVVTTHLTDLKGATFNGATDSNEAIRNRGDAAWVTATGFSTFDPATDTVARVTLVDTTTTNTDMVAAAPSAASIADAVLDEDMADHVAAGSLGKAVADVLEDTATTLPAAIDAVPTAAEVKTALEAAGSHLTLIKAKTDKMTYTSGDDLDVNVQKINDVAVTGTGAVADPWGPA